MLPAPDSLTGSRAIYQLNVPSSGCLQRLPAIPANYMKVWTRKAHLEIELTC